MAPVHRTTRRYFSFESRRISALSCHTLTFLDRQFVHANVILLRLDRNFPPPCCQPAPGLELSENLGRRGAKVFILAEA